MNKQEAIEDIEKNILPVVGGKSLRMAISALQAQDSHKPTAESVQNVKDDDLVSRKAAIDAINKALDRETLLNSFVRKVAVDALKTMPSAQPEIIHCRECKHRDKDGECGQYDDGTVAVSCKVSDDHYCGYAERRTDDQSKR